MEKVNSRCFCWFPAAILVDSFCPPIWRLHTKLYKGARNVSATNSEPVGHKDLRFGQIVYILVFYNISFSWLLPLDGFKCIFLCPVYCVTVKTKNPWGKMGTTCSLIWNGPETGFQVERSEKQNRPEKWAEHDNNHQHLSTRTKPAVWTVPSVQIIGVVHRILGHTPFLSYI